MNIDNIQKENQNTSQNPRISKLVEEVKQQIHKRQKSIKIAVRNKDGWQVVEEYDELVSESEDEKHLKKAKEAASRSEGRSSRQQILMRKLGSVHVLIVSFFVVSYIQFRLVSFVNSHVWLGSACESNHKLLLTVL